MPAPGAGSSPAGGIRNTGSSSPARSERAHGHAGAHGRVERIPAAATRGQSDARSRAHHCLRRPAQLPRRALPAAHSPPLPGYRRPPLTSLPRRWPAAICRPGKTPDQANGRSRSDTLPACAHRVKMQSAGPADGRAHPAGLVDRARPPAPVAGRAGNRCSCPGTGRLPETARSAARTPDGPGPAARRRAGRCAATRQRRASRR